MTKRLFHLYGLAILAVVCSHAAGWAFIAMFFWADRYRSVTVPNYDQIGTATYYILWLIRSLSSFAVPAFLFVSGFFVAYAARGNRSTLTWKMVRARLKNLLIPYLIWSFVILLGDALQGHIYSPVEYLERILLGQAHAVYFFVPLICQLYVLSPWIVPMAKSNPRKLLIGSILLQAAVLGLRYLDLFGLESSTLRSLTDLFFGTYIVSFALGAVASFHLRQLKQWLLQTKWILLGALVITAALTVLESEVVFCLTGIRRGTGAGTLSTSIYSLTLILCFLAFAQVPIPFSKTIYKLGIASYGIYLLHPPVLELSARTIRQIAPWLLAQQVLFALVLAVVGVSMPLLFMTLVSKSPLRRFHRYLFG